MAKDKKAKTPMDKLTKGYETFIGGKEINPNGEALFNETIKKASKPKQRGSK